MPQLEDLDSDEPLPRRVQRHDFDRMIMLADGVFAIAITLAAIEVRVPAAGSAREVLAEATPALVAYGVSFTVIAAFWAGHRRLMARLARIDAVATALQLGLLGLVALIPAATRMIVSVQLKTQDVYLLYLGLIAACGAVNGANWLYAAFSGRLLAPEVTRGAALAQAISAIATPVLTSTAVLTFIRQPSGLTVGVLVAVVVVLGLGRRAASRRFPI